MKITIESTSKVVELQNGAGVMPARIWEGETESGIPVHCFITRIAPTIEDRPGNVKEFREFERELQEQRAPSAAVFEIPLRLIL